MTAWRSLKTGSGPNHAVSCAPGTGFSRFRVYATASWPCCTASLMIWRPRKPAAPVIPSRISQGVRLTRGTGCVAGAKSCLIGKCVVQPVQREPVPRTIGWPRVDFAMAEDNRVPAIRFADALAQVPDQFVQGFVLRLGGQVT